MMKISHRSSVPAQHRFVQNQCYYRKSERKIEREKAKYVHYTMTLFIDFFKTIVPNIRVEA